ncbi:MAG: ABC transporter permease [Candidatus Bathyarchaeia archaeon]
MSILSTVVTLVIAYPVAYFLAFKVESFRFQNILLFLLIIPYWVDWSIRSISWLSILGRDGIVNYLLLSLGWIKEPIGELLFTRWTLLIIWAQTNMLFMIFPIYLALIKIDPELLNVAQALGASPSRTFYHVTFKLSLPGVIVGSVFVFVSTIGDYVTPALWAGGLQTLGLTVQNYAWLFEWPVASTFAVLMLAVTVTILYVMLKTVNIKQVFYE